MPGEPDFRAARTSRIVTGRKSSRERPSLFFFSASDGRMQAMDMNNESLNGLVSDVAARFGLSNEKVRQLVGVTVTMMFDDRRGGLPGFLQLFRQRGLEPVIASWQGPGPAERISSAQLESVFGIPLINAIAGRLGATGSTTTAALGGLLPGLVNRFSDSQPPHTDLPDMVKDWARSVAPWFVDLGRFEWGGMPTHTMHAMATPAAAQTTAPAKAKTSGGMGRVLFWLLLLLAVLAALLLYRGCSRQAQQAPAAPAVEATPAPAPVAQTPARFTLEESQGKAIISGQLASQADRQRLMDALKASFGAEQVSGDISVDPNTAPAGWLEKLIALAPSLKAKGLKLGFDGEAIRIDTSALPEAERMQLSQTLRDGFGGFEISGLWDKAMMAFAALKPGFGADDLVKALNQSHIGFDTGSNAITRDSFETLTRAAEAIKAAPAGTRIEVGGHTDNTGTAEVNLQVSQQRADAVVAKLVELGVAPEQLLAKAYGQTQPAADNASEAGRAANRRIAFTVLK